MQGKTRKSTIKFLYRIFLFLFVILKTFLIQDSNDELSRKVYEGFTYVNTFDQGVEKVNFRIATHTVGIGLHLNLRPLIK